MTRFKTLEYSKQQKYKNIDVQLRMFVPGVNSGVYDKALHIEVFTTKQNLFSFKKQFAAITLNKKQVEELRDECNKILALP